MCCAVFVLNAYACLCLERPVLRLLLLDVWLSINAMWLGCFGGGKGASKRYYYDDLTR